MSLKNSKTEQNLKDAFAGESQANRRYLYFAAKADVEGYNDVAAAFRSHSWWNTREVSETSLTLDQPLVPASASFRAATNGADVSQCVKSASSATATSSLHPGTGTRVIVWCRLGV